MVGCGVWSTLYCPTTDTGRRSSHFGFSHIATAVEVFVIFDGPCQLFGLLGSYGGIQLVVRHCDVDWAERKIVADLQG